MAFQKFDEPEKLLMETLTSMQRITVMCRIFPLSKHRNKMNIQYALVPPKFSFSYCWTKKLSTVFKSPRSLIVSQRSSQNKMSLLKSAAHKGWKQVASCIDRQWYFDLVTSWRKLLSLPPSLLPSSPSALWLQISEINSVILNTKYNLL